MRSSRNQGNIDILFYGVAFAVYARIEPSSPFSETGMASITAEGTSSSSGRVRTFAGTGLRLTVQFCVNFDPTLIRRARSIVKGVKVGLNAPLALEDE